MERFFLLASLSLWKPLVLAQSHFSLPEEDRRVRTYIVHVRKPRSLVLRSVREREDWHKSFLPSLSLDSGEPRLVYSYQHAVGGFAARLTSKEAEAMETADGVLSVQPDSELKPRTTHSSQFSGLTRSGQLWEISNGGKGKVIGVIEIEFNPDHVSFSDDGMAPKPRRWKGKCDFLPEHCNKKLIGNKLFNASDPYHPDKKATHGTHVASIAAGNLAINAGFRGEACGTASGSAPRAHLAFYNAPFTSDFLMAVDTAIDDGIDVLSVSIGVNGLWDFPGNPMATAALSATEHGIFVSAAAGNGGPHSPSIDDNTPWTLSVGASTTDRVTRVEIRLGNGDVVNGETAHAKSDFFPVGATLPAVVLGDPSRLWGVGTCEGDDAVRTKVMGKAVICVESEYYSPRADLTPENCKIDYFGGKALILLNERMDGSTLRYSYYCRIPTVMVKNEDEERLRTYVASNPNPTLSLEPVGTLTGTRRHPTVAAFSARGPSLVNNRVLKPDILGPGVNVLAANALSRTEFFFQSGTSMACPHLSGIAAMLRSLHPTWSPAMIKSAIMTTADWQDNAGMPIADHTGKPASLHAMGAGQVNATRAVDPGLVYDIQYCDYVKYVCGLNYTQEDVEIVVRKPVNCRDTGAISGEELNYPSFSVEATFNFKTITRTLMNVGRPRETYILSLNEPREVMIDVFPRTLNFSYFRQNLTYTVTIIAMTSNPDGTAEGQLTWVSTYHRVRSPIAITFA